MKSAVTILRLILPSFLMLVAWTASAQAVMTATGNWEDPLNWSGSNIGNALGETVTINTGVSPTVHAGISYTVGNTTLTQDNNLTVESATSLTIGASGTPRNLVTNLNASLTVNGLLEIWGDLTANSNVVLNITGTVHIHGNLALNGNTNVTVQGSGNLIVGGNMTGGNNINFTVNGRVEVFGNVNIGGGSNLNGTGTFILHGTCNGTPFCSSGILPVDLLYFKTKLTPSQIDLVWATASERDVDYFILERSRDGKVFNEIGKIAAMGDSHTERMYSFTDEKPSIGISYFRLNEYSRGGQKKILATIKHDFDGGKALTIYPNPVSRDQPLSLSLNFSTSEPHEISVFDIRGVLMGKAIMNGEETTLPLNLSSGVYIVRLVSRDFSAVQRLIVQ
jgi:hypothetical protein